MWEFRFVSNRESLSFLIFESSTKPFEVTGDCFVFRSNCFCCYQSKSYYVGTINVEKLIRREFARFSHHSLSDGEFWKVFLFVIDKSFCLLSIVASVEKLQWLAFMAMNWKGKTIISCSFHVSHDVAREFNWYKSSADHSSSIYVQDWKGKDQNAQIDIARIRVIVDQSEERPFEDESGALTFLLCFWYSSKIFVGGTLLRWVDSFLGDSMNRFLRAYYSS
jgi:hypothetical protein